jgi:hypothetical protein
VRVVEIGVGIARLEWIMDGDLAAAVVPYVAAAAGAYGAAVIERVQNAAADATVDTTVGLGRRLLGRILRKEESAAPVAAAVSDLAQDPEDDDRVAAMRLQIRKLWQQTHGWRSRYRTSSRTLGWR